MKFHAHRLCRRRVRPAALTTLLAVLVLPAAWKPGALLGPAPPAQDGGAAPGPASGPVGATANVSSDAGRGGSASKSAIVNAPDLPLSIPAPGGATEVAPAGSFTYTAT